jgi:glycosyltransferase involved in cell wall biosynthesis
MSEHKLTILIPTKDRPEQLRRLLESLSAQSVLPDRVVVVASGSQDSKEVVDEFPKLNIQYLHVTRAGTSWQRNAGLAVLDPGCTLVGFFDDDVVLEPDAVEKMLIFWEMAPSDVGGAGFNFRNATVAPETARKWRLGPLVWIYNAFMLRDAPKGKVLPSGFPTPIFPVTENIYTDWLETLGLTLRREVVDQFKFDDFFAGYSYLEHVEFTYRVSHKYKLCAVCKACVTHHCAPIKNSYLLGKMQVINRIHFVRKFRELSPVRCYFALVAHMFFNLVVGTALHDGGYFKRAWGNCVGLTLVLTRRAAPVAGDVK